MNFRDEIDYTLQRISPILFVPTRWQRVATTANFRNNCGIYAGRVVGQTTKVMAIAEFEGAGKSDSLHTTCDCSHNSFRTACILTNPILYPTLA